MLNSFSVSDIRHIGHKLRISNFFLRNIKKYNAIFNACYTTSNAAFELKVLPNTHSKLYQRNFLLSCNKAIRALDSYYS